MHPGIYSYVSIRYQKTVKHNSEHCIRKILANKASLIFILLDSCWWWGKFSHFEQKRWLLYKDVLLLKYLFLDLRNVTVLSMKQGYFKTICMITNCDKNAMTRGTNTIRTKVPLSFILRQQEFYTYALGASTPFFILLTKILIIST